MIIGIDYSMTCPAACALTPSGPAWWFANNRSYDHLPPELSHQFIDTTDMLPRAERCAAGLIAWASAYPGAAFTIEDYAFNATGRVFNIGEHTGLLKYLLWKRAHELACVPPTVVKKFATGKGNADKTKMVNAFLTAYPTSRQWIPHFFPRTKGGTPDKSPFADLADAYWIANYAASLTTKP